MMFKLRSPRFIVFRPKNRFGTTGAFTLVELLISIGVVAVLAALLMSGAKAAMFAARRADSVSTLKGIGTALMSYASDYETLPGPLYTTQDPRYYNNARYLVTYLWPYFDEKEPVFHAVPKWYVAKHWRAWYAKNTPDKKPYSVAGEVVTRDGEKIIPFGYSSPDPAQAYGSMKWSRVASSIDLSKTYSLADTFNTSKATDRAPRGLLQNYQGILYFDGHVETPRL